jgi:hypothetical protein
MPIAAVVAAIALVVSPAALAVVTISTPNSTNPVAGGISAMSGGGFGSGALTRGGSAAANGSPGAAPGAGPRVAPVVQLWTVAERLGNAESIPGRRRSVRHAVGADRYTDSRLAHRARRRWSVPRRRLRRPGGGEAHHRLGRRLVPAVGGFNGGDPVPTLDAFQRIVADGDVTYVVTSSGAVAERAPPSARERQRRTPATTGSTTSAQIRSWVCELHRGHGCAPVSDLYDCAG